MKNKGTLFWITGLSGSGKTTLAKKIFPYLNKKYGKTIHLDGDILRKKLNLYGYSYEERLENSKKFTRVAKLLTDQGVNVVFSLVCLMNKPRAWNKKNISNYIEIFIKTELRDIIAKKKNIYKKKNVVGLNIRPQFPKNPHIVLFNSTNKTMISLVNELKKKLKNLDKNK